MTEQKNRDTRKHHCATIAGGMFTVVALLAVSANAQPTGTLTEREVIRAVLQENQTLKAALAKWEMMKARVPQARAWEDLRAGVDWRAERSVNVPPNSFMDQTAMLEQEVPISGKNRSRSRAATAEARAAFEDLRRMELDLIMRARSAYARLANGYAQLEVNRRNTELLNQFVQISRSRYEAGVATQADVLLAQTDAAKLLETQADIERQISQEQSALNVLMNRPAQAASRPAFRTCLYAASAFIGNACRRARSPCDRSCDERRVASTQRGSGSSWRTGSGFRIRH